MTPESLGFTNNHEVGIKSIYNTYIGRGNITYWIQGIYILYYESDRNKWGMHTTDNSKPTIFYGCLCFYEVNNLFELLKKFEIKIPIIQRDKKIDNILCKEKKF